MEVGGFESSTSGDGGAGNTPKDWAIVANSTSSTSVNLLAKSRSSMRTVSPLVYIRNILSSNAADRQVTKLPIRSIHFEIQISAISFIISCT